MVRSASSAAASSGLIPPPPSSVQPIWTTPSNIPQAIHQHSTSDSSSFNEPIHAGYIKQLKLFAKQHCNTLKIPEKAILEFIDIGNLFYMLVDMKATMTKGEFTQQANQFQGLQDTLWLKDFEVVLQNCLLACMLSPNITAYMTEAQHHILEFISEHPDVFKVPAAVFKDDKLRSQLGKLVVKLLSTIHSQIRSQLTISIAKKTCIIDMTKALIQGSSGLDVEATHWNRMAFLEHMRVDGGEDIDAATAALLAGRRVLGTNAEFGGDTGDSINANVNTNTNTTPDVNANSGVPDTEESSEDLKDLDYNDFGFRLDDKPLQFNDTKFWNYVDYMLSLMCNVAHKDAVSKQEYEGQVAW
ncbi:hypothetical protein PAXRUDRAFT_17563 [Paxillus rubicundulus Ve08.2h10]|uniref:Uncharacterized protein n=1 Tax=Paxillus rubicundulus Ve08.2h10 TaxID=930991 RepID=A0A0D0CPU5_9AGAM|nr:hypothetical protein PAXRUDRAFT_17563 [Paxillus rubicundulus Ve08.2h10]